MAKLTADRDTLRREGDLCGFEAGERIFCGGMVAMNDAGKLVAASASGGTVVGVADEGGQPGERVRVRRGVFCFANDASAITLADIGGACVVVDDQTVGKAAGESASGATAGMIYDVEPKGVWVKI